MKLSILIPTIERDKELFTKLKWALHVQLSAFNGEYEILVDDSETDSIGIKRNRLLQDAKGDYVAFFDSDDWPSPNYVGLLMKAIESGSDCASLRGEYSVDGVFDGFFEHSLKYKKWETVEGVIKYLRYPNHLNLCRASLAKQISFTDKNHGEDYDWSKAMHESGLLKTEYYIPEIIYFYKKVNHKK